MYPLNIRKISRYSWDCTKEWLTLKQLWLFLKTSCCSSVDSDVFPNCVWITSIWVNFHTFSNGRKSVVQLVGTDGHAGLVIPALHRVFPQWLLIWHRNWGTGNVSVLLVLPLLFFLETWNGKRYLAKVLGCMKSRLDGRSGWWSKRLSGKLNLLAGILVHLPHL